MKRGNMLVMGVPLIKQYMEENDVALTVEKAAEVIKGSRDSAYYVLLYMDGAGIVKRVKRGASFYVLMDAINEGRLESVLDKSVAPRLKIPFIRRPRATIPRIRPRSMDEAGKHLASMRERAESAEGPSALGILGLPLESGVTKVEEEIPLVLKPIEESLELPPQVDQGIIRVEPFGSVMHITKGTRLLSRGEAGHLRSYLRGFEGCEKVDGYKCFFVNASAIQRGEYGNVFYVSNGSNSWDRVQRVTLDDSIFRYQPLSSTERNMWANWKAFDDIISHKPRYSREDYEKILDSFIDGDDDMVEITVKDRTALYLKMKIMEIIKDRELEDEIDVSTVDKWLYLEKLK